MSKNKKTPSDKFTDLQIKTWEESDGVNFAIALARITNWCLQVDWFNPDKGTNDISKMKSLRVYVQDNQNNIFDLKGKFSPNSFHLKIVEPILNKRVNVKKFSNGGVAAKYHTEEAMFDLPLRVKPIIERVNAAEEIIRNNIEFLNKIPKRPSPIVPAYTASQFSFGHCALFAEAMKDIANKKPIEMIAQEYTPQFGFSKTGYAHTFLLNPDGSCEDIWGIQSIEQIAARFGIVRYILDENGHSKRIASFKEKSLEKYNEVYAKAVEIGHKYFLQPTNS